MENKKQKIEIEPIMALKWEHTRQLMKLKKKQWNDLYTNSFCLILQTKVYFYFDFSTARKVLLKIKTK